MLQVPHLDLVSHKAPLAYALADKEPEDDLQAHEGVERGLPHGQVPPGARLGRGDQVAKAAHDLGQLPGRGRHHLHPGVLDERLQPGSGALDDGVGQGGDGFRHGWSSGAVSCKVGHRHHTVSSPTVWNAPLNGVTSTFKNVLPPFPPHEIVQVSHFRRM
ncbi:unnamed protein product [Ixodes pacificus]